MAERLDRIRRRTPRVLGVGASPSIVHGPRGRATPHRFATRCCSRSPSRTSRRGQPWSSIGSTQAPGALDAVARSATASTAASSGTVCWNVWQTEAMTISTSRSALAGFTRGAATCLRRRASLPKVVHLATARDTVLPRVRADADVTSTTSYSATSWQLSTSTRSSRPRPRRATEHCRWLTARVAAGTNRADPGPCHRGRVRTGAPRPHGSRIAARAAANG